MGGSTPDPPCVARCGTTGRRRHQHPAQDLAWERWGACNHFSTITFERIELDGRLVVNGFEVDDARFAACVREAAADQVRRGGVDMPQALVLVKIYGCQGGAM